MTREAPSPFDRPQVSIAERMQRYDMLPKIGDEYDPTSPRTPNVIVRQNGSQLLVVIGCQHRYDPRDQIYTTINAAWDFFNRNTAGTNRVILSEGRPVEFFDNETAAIQARAERGVLRHLSQHHSIPMESGDSLQYSESDMLLERGFKPEDILYYYALREVPQWHRSWKEASTSYEDKMKKTLARYEEALTHSRYGHVWQHVRFAPDTIARIHRAQFGRNAYHLSQDLYFALEQTQNFAASDTITQKIARHCNAARDEHLSGKILNKLGEGTSIFSVFGWQHVFAIEKDLTVFGDILPNDFASASPPPAPERSDPFYGGPERSSYNPQYSRVRASVGK